VKSKSEVLIIDYGMGNLWSVRSAFEHLNCTVKISSEPEEIGRANRLILPGVGSFRIAMETLMRTGIAEAVIDAVKRQGVYIFGICLGMQLLGSSSPEDGETDVLGLIDVRVDQFGKGFTKDLKIPHVGFDVVKSGNGSHLFKDMPCENDFYFVHEYRMQNTLHKGVSSTCRYGETFLAAYEFENIFATQFHPEKSQANGLMLLSNFLELT
jgi:glutamine amidotransferase